jgi:hypothetical protein
VELGPPTIEHPGAAVSAAVRITISGISLLRIVRFSFANRFSFFIRKYPIYYITTAGEVKPLLNGMDRSFASAG